MRRLELVPTVPICFPRRSMRSGNRFFRIAASVSVPFSGLLRAIFRGFSGQRFHPVIAAGTGTWANELMVWNTAPGARRLLVVSNGEFGDRLLKQCRICRPDTIALKLDWGEAYAQREDRIRLAAHPDVDWIFGVATETSCGRANDIALLERIAGPRGIRIALDGVSAVGLAPELFKHGCVRVVTASSGKALARAAGHFDSLSRQCREARRFRKPPGIA